MWAGLLARFGLDMPYYFLKEIPRPAWVIYVHAAVFIGWMLILTTQVMLIQSKRFDPTASELWRRPGPRWWRRGAVGFGNAVRLGHDGTTGPRARGITGSIAERSPPTLRRS